MDELLKELGKLESFINKVIGDGVTLHRLKIPTTPGGESGSDDPENCLVLQTTLDAGAVFDPYYIERAKFLVCAKGHLVIKIQRFWGWQKKILHTGQAVTIPANKIHYAKAVKDSAVIAVVVFPEDSAMEGRRVERNNNKMG